MNIFWRSLWPPDNGGQRRFNFNNNAKQDDRAVVLAQGSATFYGQSAI